MTLPGLPGTNATVRGARRCSRTGCVDSAVATLTYVYADSTVVLGPLAIRAEPHSYDLCASHATRMTAPRGWEIVRLGGTEDEAAGPGPDDLAALADAVREAGRPRPRPEQPAAPPVGRRGHLRLLRDNPH